LNCIVLTPAVGDSDRKAVAGALRPIYTAPTIASAAQELDIFEGSNWGKHYPSTVRVWRDAWERFIGSSQMRV